MEKPHCRSAPSPSEEPEFQTLSPLLGVSASRPSRRRLPLGSSESHLYLPSSKIQRLEGSVHVDSGLPVLCRLSRVSSLPFQLHGQPWALTAPRGFLIPARPQLSAWACPSRPAWKCSEGQGPWAGLPWSHFFQGSCLLQFLPDLGCSPVSSNSCFFVSYPEFITITDYRVSSI